MVSPSCFIIRNFRNDGNFRNEYSNTNQTNSHELNIREDSGNSCSLLFLLAVWYKNSTMRVWRRRRYSLADIQIKKEVFPSNCREIEKDCVFLQLERRKSRQYHNQHNGILILFTPRIRDDAGRRASSVAVGTTSENRQTLHELPFLSREVCRIGHHCRRHQDS